MRRSAILRSYLQNPDSYQAQTIRAGDACGDGVLIFPTSGMIGYVWDDSFRPGHRHSGLDIFGGEDVGKTQIIAAYDGYLYRLADWKSSVILRIPSDPLHPDQQIWLYYTHMADQEGNSLIDSAFPPGTTDVFVAAGTVLGYQGNYSGTAGNPVGVHLHFSIVKSGEDGGFLNETSIENTLDPTAYFGFPLSHSEVGDDIPVCP